MVILKLIHYYWFNKGELPELALKCIHSWKHFYPDYRIAVWDVSNYNIRDNAYVLEAYNHRKWEFLKYYLIGEVNLVEKTASSHHYEGTLKTPTQNKQGRHTKKIIQRHGYTIGYPFGRSINILVSLKADGLCKTTKKIQKLKER